jgi:hypothetical protein
MMDLTLDGNGDVIWGGYFNSISQTVPSFNDLGVIKLSGVDGSETWRTTMDVDGGRDEVWTLAVDPLGDVFAGGVFEDATPIFDSIVVKLDGAFVDAE